MPPFSTGNRVSQAQYGTGTITYVNEYHTIVEFDEAGRRTFVTERVELTPSDTEAPVRAKKKSVRKKKVSVDAPAAQGVSG